jgi:hypothetical protein
LHGPVTLVIRLLGEVSVRSLPGGPF